MSTPFGLCDGCAHQRRVGNTRGSTFSLCGRARTDERFPKYPRMPVLRCAGYERREGGDAPMAPDPTIGARPVAGDGATPAPTEVPDGR